jgi:hypothetical protein
MAENGVSAIVESNQCGRRQNKKQHSIALAASVSEENIGGKPAMKIMAAPHRAARYRIASLRRAFSLRFLLCARARA